MRRNIREADIRRKTRTKVISDFIRRVMPDTAKRELPSSQRARDTKKLIVPKVEAKIPSSSKDIVYETPKEGFTLSNDDDAVTAEERAQTEDEKENFGTVASPPSSRCFLDTQHGIRKGGEQLMIGDSRCL